MDALSKLLRAMRLSGCVFFDAEFTAPWCVAGRARPEDLPPDMPVPGHLMEYHYVVDGELYLQSNGGAPLLARKGALLLLPRNDFHMLSSHTGLKPVENDALNTVQIESGIARIRYGGGGKRTQMLCGYLGTDDINNPLLMCLPTVMQLDLLNTSTGAWIQGAIRHTMRELSQGGPAVAANLATLAEVLFAEAVRSYLKDLPEGQSGWLAGLRDPVTSKAIALIHTQLDRPWTLEHLAREVGASRSSLIDKFVRLVDASPMQYLRRRRLLRAAEELDCDKRTVSEIGFAAGYESEAAFSRAFKREFGVSPKAYRNAGRPAPETASGSGGSTAAKALHQVQ